MDSNRLLFEPVQKKIVIIESDRLKLRLSTYKVVAQQVCPKEKNHQTSIFDLTISKIIREREIS